VYLATAQSDGVHVLVSPVDQDAFADLATPLAFGAGPVFDVSMAADGDLFWMVYNDRLVAGGILAEAGVADATWLPPAAALGGPVRVFAAAGTGRVWAIADTGVWGGDVEHPLSRIYLSIEGGVAWQELQSPPGTQLGLSFAAGFGNGLPTAYVSAGTDLTVTELDSISDPPGWTTVFTIADATVSSIAAPAAGVVDVRVSVTADGHQELRRSTDGGATWQTLVRAAA